MEDKRKQFGNRFLTNPRDVFEHNAWDDAEWDEEQEEEAKRLVMENSSELVADDLKEKYETGADNFWDQFYSQHQNRFFKDRHWLFVQFPELAPKDYNTTDSSNPTKLEEGTSSNSAANAIKPSDTSVASSDPALESTSQLDTEQSVECVSKHDNKLENAKMLPNDERIIVQGVQGEAEDMTAEKAKKLLESARADAGLSTQEKQDNVCQGMQGLVESELSKEVAEAFPGEHGKMRVLEVGCGVGNTVFPVLQTNNDPNLFVYCCDLSETAIQLVKEHSDFESRRCHAFVADVTDLDKPLPFPEESLDAVILIFVLSAIHPDKMQATVNRLARHLKPGGMMLFRDYGRYDLVQLRFKSGKCLSPNFYVRGDGTRVYFFTQDELRTMFLSAGLTEEVQNYQDRRLQVNRGRQLKMYRVWIQCKYRKPLVT